MRAGPAQAMERLLIGHGVLGVTRANGAAYIYLPGFVILAGGSRLPGGVPAGTAIDQLSVGSLRAVVSRTYGAEPERAQVTMRAETLAYLLAKGQDG